MARTKKLTAKEKAAKAAKSVGSQTKGKIYPSRKPLDVAGLVSRFGGRTVLLYRLRDYGYISPDPLDPQPEVFARALTVRGIDQWVQRGTIPAHWLQVLQDLHPKVYDGAPLPLDEYRLLPLAPGRGKKTAR